MRKFGLDEGRKAIRTFVDVSFSERMRAERPLELVWMSPSLRVIFSSVPVAEI